MQTKGMGSSLSELEIRQYQNCHLCPRNCGVDRLKGEKGFCGTGPVPVVARAALHYWEEPCISGENGSGAVFFSGCNMRCIFCQNREISRGLAGKAITAGRLCEIFLELQEKGANNINLVTGVQFIPSIAAALKSAGEKGLSIPVVYNCGGYESVEALKLLWGLVDIYLPDFKYWSEAPAAGYSHAGDYPQRAKEALAEMVRQTGNPVFDGRGIMQKGVMVRHLLLPGERKEAEHILAYLYETYGEKIYYSIMNQYTPIKPSGAENAGDDHDPAKERVPKELYRKVTAYEYDKTIEYAWDLGIRKGYMQEGKTAEECFIPPFDLEGVEKQEKDDRAAESRSGK